MNKIIQNLIAIVTGFLTNLTTTDKSNLVAAINEVNAKPYGGDLQSVTDTGNVTTNDVILDGGDLKLNADEGAAVYFNAPANSVFNLLRMTTGTPLTVNQNTELPNFEGVGNVSRTLLTSVNAILADTKGNVDLAGFTGNVVAAQTMTFENGILKSVV